MGMRELFDECRLYGAVDIFTGSNGTYSVNITFNTIAHCELKASSGHGHHDVELAMQNALKKAKEIVDSFPTKESFKERILKCLPTRT